MVFDHGDHESVDGIERPGVVWVLKGLSMATGTGSVLFVIVLNIRVS